MTQKRTSSSFTQSIRLLAFVILVGTASLWSAAIKLQVTAEQANVREKPDIMSAVLEQLPEGAILEAERKEGEWFAVLVEREEGGSVLGYVHESLVKVIKGEPQKKEQEPQPQVERKPVAEKEEKPAPPPAQAPAISPQEQKEEGMSMALWLGWRYAAIGDLNDGASGAAGYYQAMFQGSADASGEAKSLHFGRLFGLELRLPLSYGFSLAFGGEYFSGVRASEVIFEIGSSQFIAKAEPRVRAVPLNVSLLYYPGPHLYLRAGIEYTFARCGYLYRLEQPLSWQEDEGYADAGALGYLLGIGTEWQLFSGLSCVAEAAYRRARFGDLEGVNIYRESTGYGSTKKGGLYYFEVKPSSGGVFPLVYVREQEPADASVIIAREAVLSLTGLSLKLGFRFRI
ncbi:MAG: SH3 domain-containing protein [Acidobacteriota bacterium]